MATASPQWRRPCPLFQSRVSAACQQRMLPARLEAAASCLKLASDHLARSTLTVHRAAAAFSPQIYGSPQQSVCSDDSADESMQENHHDLTPDSDGSSGSDSASPRASPTASYLEKLRLNNDALPTPEQSRRCSPGAQKRPAVDELPNPACRRSPGITTGTKFHPNGGQRSVLNTNRQPYRSSAKGPPWRRSPSFTHDTTTKQRQQTFIDSTYGSGDVKDGLPFHGRNATKLASPPPASRQWKPYMAPENQLARQKTTVASIRPSSYDGIRLQPESSPISQEQLAAEVKGIYAGLVMVEAKCINIDSQKAANPEDPLGPEQWQALIALHRTLLYEHHDFLMATQHPSANTALRGLAMKYHMPARMWKHGIHAFLEVLRHRRPDSQEYMLAFIYLAYQMMALLFETVPIFTDTWIECLGDLARYRMAIEEDKEIHATWGSVAGRWYTMASDKHPKVGRLYHHLGILERPSLRKFYFYARSLTSVVPFLNAKESLATLCSPILNDSQALRNGTHSAEAMAICFHARVFSTQPAELIERDGKTTLTLLEEQPHSKIGVYGTSLAVTNVAAILGFGAPNNVYRQAYDRALGLDSSSGTGVQDFQHSTSAPSSSVSGVLQRPLIFVISFAFCSFNTIVARQPNREEANDLLPYTHVSLIFLTSLLNLRPYLAKTDPLISLLDSSATDWAALATFLNRLASFFPITSRIEMFARSGTFPAEGKPLHEDYLIRGLLWSQWYFPVSPSPDWFDGTEDDDGSRALEDADRQRRRAERVLYLGLTLALKTKSLRYDGTRKTFSAATGQASRLSGGLASPKSISARSSASGDFVMVSPTQASPPRKGAWHMPRSYASIAGSAAGSAAAVKQEPMRAGSKPSKAIFALNGTSSVRVKDEVELQ